MKGYLAVMCINDNLNQIIEKIIKFFTAINPIYKGTPSVKPYWKDNGYSVVETQFVLESMEKDYLLKNMQLFTGKKVLDNIINFDNTLMVENYMSFEEMETDHSKFFCTLYVNKDI